MKWSYFQNVSQINEAKSLINNVSSSVQLRCSDNSSTSWSRFYSGRTRKSFPQSGMNRALKNRGKYSTRPISNTDAWRRKACDQMTPGHSRQIGPPQPENIFVNIYPGPRQLSLYKTNTLWAVAGSLLTQLCLPPRRDHSYNSKPFKYLRALMQRDRHRTWVRIFSLLVQVHEREQQHYSMRRAEMF